MNLFQSEKFGQKFPHLRLPERRSYAFAYHLGTILPKNGIVEVLSPGPILKSLISQVAFQKQCKVLCRDVELKHELAQAGILAQGGTPDVVLIESDFLTEGGVLVLPQIAQNTSLVGICSVEKWTKSNPSTHDFVPLRKIVTEVGIFSPEDLKRELMLCGVF